MTRRWLEKLIDEYIPAIATLSNTDAGHVEAHRWAEWMKEQWAKHGLKSLSQQRNLMTDVRNAIKQRLGEDHFALESMNFAPDEWTHINHSIEDRVAEQNESQIILSPKTVNAIVYRATNLLVSREWADIAAGLAVLTGRRHTEILKTAEFEFKSAYSVMFTGALKRRHEADGLLKIEIPTLCRADYVLKAIAKLREILPTANLSNTQVNSKYSGPVTRACDRHFATLVPPTTGREKLYTHLFRKVYATIAHYFYCPRWVSDWEFKAHIQGHYAFINADNPVMRRKIAADRHYDAYAIEDEQGNRRKGIKLSDRDRSVIEVFQPKESTMSRATNRQDDQHDNDLEPDSGYDSTHEVSEASGLASYPQHISLDEAVKLANARGLEIRKGTLGNWKRQGGDKFEQLERQYGISYDFDLAESLPIGNSTVATWLDLWGNSHPSAALPSPTPSPDAMPQIKMTPSKSPSKQRSESPEQLTQQPSQQAAADAVGIGEIRNLSEGIAFLTAEIQRERQLRQQLEQDNAELQATLEKARADLKTLTEQVPDTSLQVKVDQLELQNSRLQAALNAAIGAGGTAPQQATSHFSTTPTPRTATPSHTAPPTPSGNASTPTPQIRSNTNGDALIHQALDAIMAYNNESARSHDQKWAISFPVMKDLCAQVGAATQSRIKRVFDARRVEIDQHHQQHGLGKRHNRKHQHESISHFIQLPTPVH
ncbi:MAG: protelomerase family protein [Elainellaceae cyanobacterium]